MLIEGNSAFGPKKEISPNPELYILSYRHSTKFSVYSQNVQKRLLTLRKSKMIWILEARLFLSIRIELNVNGSICVGNAV